MIGEEVESFTQSGSHLQLNFKSGATLMVKLSFGVGGLAFPRLSVAMIAGPRSPADDAQTTRGDDNFKQG